MALRVGLGVNRRTLGWALAFAVAALVLALGWFPGAATAAPGPRIGVTALLAMMALVLLIGSFAGALQARSERLDSKGVCPVGAKCACGHFNFKPRATCRQCGIATHYAAPAGP